MLSNSFNRKLIALLINKGINESRKASIPLLEQNREVNLNKNINFNKNNYKLLNYKDWIIVTFINLENEFNLGILNQNGIFLKFTNEFINLENESEKFYYADCIIDKSGLINLYCTNKNKTKYYYIQLEDIISQLTIENNTSNNLIKIIKKIELDFGDFVKEKQIAGNLKIVEDKNLNNRFYLFTTYNKPVDNGNVEFGIRFDAIDQSEQNGILFSNKTLTKINDKDWNKLILGLHCWEAIIETNDDGVTFFQFAINSKSGKTLENWFTFTNENLDEANQLLKDSNFEAVKEFYNYCQNNPNKARNWKNWWLDNNKKEIDLKFNLNDIQSVQNIVDRYTPGINGTNTRYTSNTYYWNHNHNPDNFFLDSEYWHRITITWSDRSPQNSKKNRYLYYMWKVDLNFTYDSDVNMFMFNTEMDSSGELTNTKYYNFKNGNLSPLDVDKIFIANNNFYVNLRLKNGTPTWRLLELKFSNSIEKWEIITGNHQIKNNVIIAKNWNNLLNYGDSILLTAHNPGNANTLYLGALYKRNDSNSFNDYVYDSYYIYNGTYKGEIALALREQNLVKLFTFNNNLTKMKIYILQYNNQTASSNPYMFNRFDNDLSNFFGSRIVGYNGNNITFDGNITDIPTYGNNIIYSAIIDKNSMNNIRTTKWVVISNTNDELLIFNEDKEKQNNTSLKLNFDTTFSIIDKTNENSYIKGAASNTLIELLSNDNNLNIVDKNRIGNFKVVYNDGTSRMSSAAPFLRKDSNYGYFEITLIQNKIIDSLLLYNKNNQVLVNKKLNLPTAKKISLSIKFQARNK